MKKISFTIVLLLLISAALLASQKVAIVEFTKNDRPSDYVYKEMVNRDFKAVFDAEESLDLINMKDADKAFKKSGFSYMGRDEAKSLGTDLDADFVIWGSISSNENDFRVSLTVYNMQTGEVLPLLFNVSKNKDERRKSMSDNIIAKIIQSTQAEMEKLMAIGLQHFNSRNYTAAEESFNKLVEIDVDNAEIYLYLGLIKFLQREYLAAIEYFEQGLEIDATNITILDYMSRSYQRLEDLDDAIEALVKITEIDDSNKEIWLKLGNLNEEMEYHAEAQNSYEKAIALDDSYSEAIMALGVLKFNQQQFDSALTYLEKASTAFPEIDHLQKKLATAYMKTGKLDAAIARYKKLLQENPNDINAYMNLANAYRVTNNNQDALKTLLDLKKLKPDLIKANLRLAETYLALKDFSKATEMTKFVLEKDPQNYEPYMIMAQINFALGYQKYEEFLWYEEEYKDKTKYWGEAADKLVEERDSVKKEAYNYFLEQEKNLNKVIELTQDPSVTKDVRSRKEILKQLKDATRPGNF